VNYDYGVPRWIELDGAVNARSVVPGVLLRSDNLQALSDSDVRVLLDQQALEAVMDLRSDVEVQLEGPGPLMQEPKVRVEHHSLYPESAGSTSVIDRAVAPWGSNDPAWPPDEPPAVRSYMTYLVRRPDSVVASIRAIARADGAVLVHCAAGKDRTGVVVALALDAAGVDRELIADDYLASSLRIEAIVGRLVASPTYRDHMDASDIQRHAPVAGTIERVLELVDDCFGGSSSWLSANGLSDEDLLSLRRRLASGSSLGGWPPGQPQQRP
jgi:protein-tyrosine phosphatase